MSELRHDPLTDRWVIISVERGARPIDAQLLEKKKSELCPFCPGNEDQTPVPEIYAVLKDGHTRHSVLDRNYIHSDWLIRVIPNKYPALQPEILLSREGIGIYDKISGIGAHEILIESPEHSVEIPLLPLQQVVIVFNTIKLRMNDLEKNHYFRYLSLYKNKGESAGASLGHPHWQLNALPITPSEVARELHTSQVHYEKKERCLICDILSQEIKSGGRMVETNETFAVLAPFSSRFAGELLIAPLPHFHCSSFPGIDDKTIEVLALVLRRTLARLMRGYNDSDYNIVLHTAPFFRQQKNDDGKTIEEDYHWHLHIFPRIAKIAGFELGNDCYINTVPPEDVAKTLREAAV